MSSLCLDQERLRVEHPVSPTHTATAPPCFPCNSGSSILIDGQFEGSLTENQAWNWAGKEFTKGGRSRVTIDMLPDVVLLEIFDLYMHIVGGVVPKPEWHTLVHVCRKWRNIVFGSPRRLDLRLYCTDRTPVREKLGVWPPLPMAVYGSGPLASGVDNLIAALEHSDRIFRLDLHGIPNLQMEEVLAVMQQPFPALTWLDLAAWDRYRSAPVVPASLLDGSAPRLQHLSLDFISFPGLPKLLLSATHLVWLTLWNIPHSGYFSPEAIVTCFPMLTRLKMLQIGFKSPLSRPDRRSRRPPPLTRTVLPVLTGLRFVGVSEYLEDLVAWIDAPLLHELTIIFFHQLIFDTPQLTQFISRTLTSKISDEANIDITHGTISVRQNSSSPTIYKNLQLEIKCGQPDWQLSSLAQVCRSFLPQILITAVKCLRIRDYRSLKSQWQDEIESIQWLEVFRPFTAVKDFYIPSEFALLITAALQEATEVLPALETLFLKEPLPSGPVQEAIAQFVAARQLSGHSLAVFRWEDENIDFREEGTDDSEEEIDGSEETDDCEEEIDD